MQTIGAPKPTHSDMALIPAQGRDPRGCPARTLRERGGGRGQSQRAAWQPWGRRRLPGSDPVGTEAIEKCERAFRRTKPGCPFVFYVPGGSIESAVVCVVALAEAVVAGRLPRFVLPVFSRDMRDAALSRPM